MMRSKGILLMDISWSVGSQSILNFCDRGDIVDIQVQFIRRNIQIVDSPTRGSSILDKILIDPRIKDRYGPATIVPTFGNADHNTVILDPVNSESAMKTRIKKAYDYRQSFLCNFTASLNSVEWDLFYRSDDSVQTKYNTFLDAFFRHFGQSPQGNPVCLRQYVRKG